MAGGALSIRKVGKVYAADGTDVEVSELALPDEPGPHFARVTSVNPTGESRPTPVIGTLLPSEGEAG